MRIDWSEHALADLKAISADVEQNRMMPAIYDAVQVLRSFPQRGRHGHVENTRELVIPGLPYMAVFRVIDERVVILNVVHSAQHWP